MGDAYHMYKAVLQNELLQDPEEGVNYFQNTLKKYFLKGTKGRTRSSSFSHQNLNSFL